MSSLIIQGDCLSVLKTMESSSVNCCVTSPPYWGLRDYGHDGQIGLEKTPEEYTAKMVALFKEVKRVLKDDGTLWLNLGDSYSGGSGGYDEKWDKSNWKVGAAPNRIKSDGCKSLPSKNLVGIPWRVAFALQQDGWYLRQDIIWHKPNPMPESVTDRCTKVHEYIFLMSKSGKYYFDGEAIKENSTTFEDRPAGVVRNREYGYNSKENLNPEAYRKNVKGNMSDKGVTRTTEGPNLKSQKEKTKSTRNKRSVWTVTTKPYKGAHFATFPEDLILPCILAGCPIDGTILDPFNGAGTTGVVCKKNKRNYIGIELNPEYVKLSEQRIDNTNGVLF